MDNRLFLLSFTIILMIAVSGRAQPSGNININEGGKLWIEGSAGPVDYKCRAERLSGKGTIANTPNPQSTVKGHGDVQIAVSLPVKALNCGKKAMNSDMYNALKADSFPTISYQMLDATLANVHADTLSNSWMNIRTLGIMEIAGVQDTTSFLVQGKVLGDEQFQVKGNKPINMNTYDIDPPSKMFGLIRADKQLTVHFNVTVTLQDTVQ